MGGPQEDETGGLCCPATVLGTGRGFKTEKALTAPEHGTPSCSRGLDTFLLCCFSIWEFLPDLGAPAQMSLSW